ncbi:amidohydrolase [Nonomuraea roseoviolacea subsp. roseoviolacea]|uniref:amidohydrolase n=1 Tax=Nonomuraea roseoviolacea TaxID=103837 RepID=UPI0031E1634B
MNVAITNGYVVPMSGPPVEGGTVVIESGRIMAVGRGIAVPEGMPVVDAGGLWVLPGFVEAHTHLGLGEEGEDAAGEDLNETRVAAGAHLRAIDGVNPAEPGFADALSGGVTTAVVLPGSANPIGGQAMAVKCWGRTADEMVLRDPVGVKSALGENPKRRATSTRLGTAAVIRAALRDGRDDPVLRRVLDGELLWHQHVHRADDIATALRLADEFGHRLVLHHGTEAHLLADLLAEREIPVVIGPLLAGRSKVELRNRTMRGPALLAAAGVRVAITTDHSSVPVHLLVHQVTLAMKEGLPRQDALASITVDPARIMGLDDRVGALRPGLDGDVVLWSGDPLDVMSRALRVFVAGREVYRHEDGRRPEDGILGAYR